MTSSNGNIFRVTGPLCGEFTGHRWIPRTQRSVTRSFHVFFDLRLNKRLSKRLWGWWSETPSRSLWRHCNVYYTINTVAIYGQATHGARAPIPIQLVHFSRNIPDSSPERTNTLFQQSLNNVKLASQLEKQHAMISNQLLHNDERYKTPRYAVIKIWERGHISRHVNNRRS